MMKFAAHTVATADLARVYVDELAPVAGNVYRVNRGPLLEFGVDEVYDTEAEAFAAGRAKMIRMIANMTDFLEESFDDA